MSSASSATLNYTIEKQEKDWLRTNGVNTNGVAAKIMDFD